jgi:hypothetical protein
VVAFVAVQPLDLLYVSVVTLAEVRFGASNSSATLTDGPS